MRWFDAVAAMLVVLTAAVQDLSSAETTAREVWQSSRVQGAPEPPPPYEVAVVWDSLSFNNPVEMAFTPSLDRLFIVEHGGKIFSFVPGAEKVHADLFANFRELPEATRLFALAFDPDFAENRYCYVCYVQKDDEESGSHVSRFTVTDSNPPRLDLSSEQLLITWRSGGHNGCSLQFGPDGYLYISTGDAGPAFPPDPLDAGQDVSNLLSSILRIDVRQSDGQRPYRIPADNPFVDLAEARGEIWAYGFRNPWRMSFDPHTGDLWVGDVGWELWEMVYRVQRGGNYGWSLMEGPQPVHRERRRGPTPILPPTAQHPHTESRSVTGGYVYYGTRLKELQGHYIYGDWVTGKVWALDTRQSAATPREIADTPTRIICFGLDHQNELYVVDYGGKIYRLEQRSATDVAVEFPRRLSDTGLFRSLTDLTPSPGVYRYRIAAEPWQDGVVADRVVGIPSADPIDVHADNSDQFGYVKGAFKFPEGTVFAKTISVHDRHHPRRVETQMLHFRENRWRAYNYIWNESQTDAELAGPDATESQITLADRTEPLRWQHASRTQCQLCHTAQSGMVLGFRPEQLAGVPLTSGRSQFDSLAQDHWFTSDAAKPPPSALVDPYDAKADLEQRARTYLHVNCAHCHQFQGGGVAAFDVRWQQPLNQTGLIDTRPNLGGFGLFQPRLVASGDPWRSALVYRMSKVGPGRMPYFGSHEVDAAGLRMLTDWIESLPAGEGTLAVADHPVRKQQAHQLAQLIDTSSPNGGTNGPGLQQQQEVIQSLLSSGEGALMVASALSSDGLPDHLRQSLMDAGLADSDPLKRDLFERFLPVSQRTQRLGTAIDPAVILNLAGDAEAGKRLFVHSAQLTCRQCHAVNGQGGRVGPDLSQIGRQRTVAALLESVLEPSRTIEPAYVTYLVETHDGRVLSGILAEKTEQGVVLRDAQDRLLTVATQEIAEFVPLQKSLMPEMLAQELTARQLADLLAYLENLK